MSAKTYNKILSDPNISLTLKSISALHIIKFHPQYTTKKNIFFLKTFFRVLKILTVNLMIYFTSLLKFKKLTPTKGLKKEVLIISHLINRKHLKSNEDFYLGKFEKTLKKIDKSFFKLMINHTPHNSVLLNSMNKSMNSLILANYLEFSAEISIFYKKILTFFELIHIYFQKKINFNQLYHLAISLFSSSTSFTIRINYQIINYVKLIRPNYCIFTYEGYPWERMCIHGIKSVNPKIKCIGYQHTPVTDSHNAIFNILPGNFNPTYIWCSQKTSFQILKENIKTKKKIVHLIGNLKSIKFKKTKLNDNKTFLVIPEGIYSECENLFRISLILANKYKSFKFIWRVHPVIEFKKVLESLNLKIKMLPKNVIISNNKFENDISKSTYVIYKGSAAVLKSVIMGNFPLYYQFKKERNFDPIKYYFKRKNYFKNEIDFIEKVRGAQSKIYKNSFRKKISIIRKNSFSVQNLKKIRSHLS